MTRGLLERLAREHSGRGTFRDEAQHAETLIAFGRELCAELAREVCPFCKAGVKMSHEEDLRNSYHCAGPSEDPEYVKCKATRIRKIGEGNDES